MSKVDVGGTILRGAFAKNFGREFCENPYPDPPGYYTLHRAWRYGFLNSKAVMSEHVNTPPSAAVRAGAPPYQAKRVAG